VNEEDLPIVLTFVVLAAFACLVPPQTDTFFHLRAGQSIWQSGSIPVTDNFSHTFNGRPWLNHEWLSQLLFYGIYALGGPLLLTLTSGACALLAVVASWRLTRGAAPDVRLVLLASLAVLTPSEWAVRPQALSLALLMLALWLVIRDRIGWLPVLIVAWANAHGVVLLGVIIAAVNAFEALVWNRRDAPRALGVAALCAAAPMLSPLGWHYWPRVAQTVAEARLLGIHEYRSAFADAGSVPFWLMFGVLAVAASLRLRRIAEWDRSDRLLVLASTVIGVASIVSIRNAPSFALIAVPTLARLVQRPNAGRTSPMRPVGYAFIAVTATIALAVVGFGWRDGGARLGWQPVSPGALASMRSCPGPMYNEYAAGGTLMWWLPERRVFVDGRLEAYPPEFLLRVRDADLSGRYQELFDEYGIRCAVVSTGSTLAHMLDKDSPMELQFRDERWSVFVRAKT
jgi:hypothetical protein